MAIKNFIKDGSYTRLAGYFYDLGEVSGVTLRCYESTPSCTWEQARTASVDTGETTNNEDGKGDVKIMVCPTESAKVLLETCSIDITPHLSIDATVNIHKQIYEHLATLSVFEGTVSDE